MKQIEMEGYITLCYKYSRTLAEEILARYYNERVSLSLFCDTFPAFVGLSFARSIPRPPKRVALLDVHAWPREYFNCVTKELASHGIPAEEDLYKYVELIQRGPQIIAELEDVAAREATDRRNSSIDQAVHTSLRNVFSWFRKDEGMHMMGLLLIV